MPLTASVSPQAPSAEVWKRIVARIGGAAAAGAPAPSWSSSLSFWRSLSMFAGVVSLSLLVWLYVMEGSVRAWSDKGLSAWLAGLELLLCLGLFVACTVHVRLRLKAARAALGTTHAGAATRDAEPEMTR